jgi:hypothetical protein
LLRFVSRFIIAPITIKHRRSDSPPAMLRGPRLSGAGTILLTLHFYIDSTPPHVLIRNESSDLKFICEFLRRWCHGLPYHLVWPGQILVWQLTWPRSHQLVTLARG